MSLLGSLCVFIFFVCPTLEEIDYCLYLCPCTDVYLYLYQMYGHVNAVQTGEGLWSTPTHPLFELGQLKLFARLTPLNGCIYGHVIEPGPGKLSCFPRGRT